MHARARTNAKYADDADFAKLEPETIYTSKWMSGERELRGWSVRTGEMFSREHVGMAVGRLGEVL